MVARTRIGSRQQKPRSILAWLYQLSRVGVGLVVALHFIVLLHGLSVTGNLISTGGWDVAETPHHRPSRVVATP